MEDNGAPNRRAYDATTATKLSLASAPSMAVGLTRQQWRAGHLDILLFLSSDSSCINNLNLLYCCTPDLTLQKKVLDLRCRLPSSIVRAELCHIRPHVLLS